MDVVTWNTLLHFSSTYPVDKENKEKKCLDWWLERLVGGLGCRNKESHRHTRWANNSLRSQHIYYHRKLTVIKGVTILVKLSRDVQDGRDKPSPFFVNLPGS